MSLLTLAVSTANLNLSGSLAAPSKKLDKPTTSDFIQNDETKQFWKSAFGETVIIMISILFLLICNFFLKKNYKKKLHLVMMTWQVFSVKFTDLEKALMARYTDFLDSEALCDLRLRLDNLKTGFVSCHRLSDFCGSESLSRRLQAYTSNSIPSLSFLFFHSFILFHSFSLSIFTVFFFILLTIYRTISTLLASRPQRTRPILSLASLGR